MQDAPYRLIPVKSGETIVHTKVSPEDYEWALKFRWRLVHGHASRYENGTLYMAREILGLQPGDPREGDHISRDRLDNRRSNLRIVSKLDNRRNVSPQAGCSSPFRGVGWHRRARKWKAAATFSYKSHHLGLFVEESDAARAVNRFWVERGYDAPNEV